MKMRVNMKSIFSVIVLSALVSPLTAMASGDAHGGGGSQIIDLGWRVLNFAIFAAILYFAAAKPIRNFLSGRIEGIKKELGDAEKGKEEAEKKLQEYMRKLSSLEEEVREIHETLRREGEVERDRIIESAQEAAEKIKIQADLSAQQELNKAVAAIRKEAAEAAVELAEMMLKKDLKKEDQKRLVTEYLDGLRGLN